MSWSEDLWDKWESLSRFSEQSIGCIERYGEFLDKRSRIELEYARKLQDLSYQFKGRIDDCVKNEPKRTKDLTWYKSLRKVSITNFNLANQHEIVGDGLHDLVVKEIAALVTDLRNEKTELNQKMRHCQNDFELHVSTFNGIRERYNKVSNIGEKKNLKGDCDKHLQSMVKVQNDHYSNTLPKILKSMQDWDERRSSGLQDIIKMASDVGKGVVPTVGACLNDMDEAMQMIDFQKDAEGVIKIFKSGYHPPKNASYQILKDKMDTLFIEKTSGVYEKAKPKIVYHDKPKSWIRRLEPFQQWLVFNDKISMYQHQMSIAKTQIDSTQKMIGIPSKGCDIKEINRLIRQNNKVLSSCQQKVNRYTQRRSQLEHTYALSSKEHNSQESSAGLTPSLSPDQTKSLCGTPPPSPSPLPSKPPGDTPPPPPPPQPPVPEKAPVPIDLPMVPPVTTPLPVNNSGEPFKNWMRNKTTCNALYPFEITSNGKIKMSSRSDFWVSDEKSDLGWMKVRKAIVPENTIESTIPKESFEKCLLYEHRFMALEK